MSPSKSMLGLPAEPLAPSFGVADEVVELGRPRRSAGSRRTWSRQSRPTRVERARRGRTEWARRAIT